MLGIAFLQGLLLLALYRAVESESWPSQSPLAAYPLWTLAIATPLLLLLAINRRNCRSVIALVAAFSGILLLLAVYTGWQARPHDAFPVESLTFIFFISMGLACFKALMYLQQRADKVPLTYQVLFTNSWRNFLVGVLSAVFTLIFWLILMLWAQLFKVIEIEFFLELFTKDWFIIPVLSVAFGLGISLFRDLTRVIDSITKLLHWLIKLLLPLALVVAIVFLAVLPFVGLQVLWATGNGTALLLWLLAILLFFTNAVYQDGRETNPYPLLVHRLIYGGLCVMPIIAGLSLYGLVLRLNQYGWTVERCWAFVAWFILALFALGYVVGIGRRRDDWTADLARVNTAMGLVVLAIMLLANSPLLDFRKISLASQLRRVDSGEIVLREFDFWYATHHLARPGYLAMERIKKDFGKDDPELLAMITSPTPGSAAISEAQVEKMWSKLVYRPAPFTIPAGLRPMIREHLGSDDQAPVIFRADLDGDGQSEYLLLSLHDGRIGYSQFYYETEDGWQPGDLRRRFNQGGDDFRDRLVSGEMELVTPRYKELRVGGLAFQPLPND